MKKHRFVSILVISFALGCGTEGGPGEGGGGADFGGPDSLVGYHWRSDPVSVGGVDLVLDFAFDESTVTATSTCDGSLSATAQAPVRYRYSAVVPSAGHAETAGGGCYVDVAASTFDFEIVDRRLRVMYGGEVIEFAPMGSVAGLYGTWTAAAPGIGTLVWSMGDGKIVATSECDGGLSATTEVSAAFTNRLEIAEAAENFVEDEYGLSCSVAIARDTLTYTFDGSTLLMTSSAGDELRFGRR